MSDTPRTDALYATDFHRWDGEPPDAAYHRLTDHARELERELASLKSQNETLGKLYAAQSDRLDNITDRDLSPDRRSLGNYWRAQYFESRRETANANRGIARLLRRLAGAKERIDSLHSHASAEVVAFDGQARTITMRFDFMPCAAIGERWMVQPNSSENAQTEARPPAE